MAIKVGDKMPAGTFKMMTKDGPQDLSTRRSSSKARRSCCSRCRAHSRRPATPSICRASSSKAGDFKAKGVDTIACMAVNDVFVMNAWGKHSNVGDKIMMLADGNGDYAKALGLEMDGRGFGMGTRGQRFALVVEGRRGDAGRIEAPREFKVSTAEYIASPKL